MAGSFLSRVLAIILLLVGVGLIATVAYNAGVDAGVASVGTAAAGATTVHVVRGFGGFFPWFFFFPFGFIFFIVIISLLFRAFGWRGRGYRGRGWYGHPGDQGDHGWGNGPESHLDAWHQQAHQGQQPNGGTTPGTPPGPPSGSR